MKLDAHVHCRPVSDCSYVEAAEVPELFKNSGVDAFILTNHYPNFLHVYKNNYKRMAENFISCFNDVKKAADAINIKIFFGVELRLTKVILQPEFQLIGMTPDLLLEYNDLFLYTQEELYDFCNLKDILMIQSHPFRIEQNHKVCDPRFMHGIEVLNGHRFDPRIKMGVEYAIANNMIMLAGSDMHNKEQAGRVYIDIDDSVDDIFKLRDYLKHNTPSMYFKGEYVDIDNL